MSYLEKIFSCEGKVVLITGVNGQLGSVLAEGFNKIGAKVVGLDISNHLETKNEIDYFKLDITQKKDVQDVFEEIDKKYGQLDILVNNAGVATFEPFQERTDETFDLVMDVNLKGTFNCIKSFANIYDKKSKPSGAAIINIGFYLRSRQF